MNRRQLLKYLSLLGIGQISLPLVSVATEQAAKNTRNTALVYDEAYLEHLIFEGHPESPERLKTVINFIMKAGLDKLHESFQSHNPDQVEEFLQLIHTEQHIEALKKQHPTSHKTLLNVISDVISVTTAVCSNQFDNAFCATRPPGHHAENTGKIEGFCLYNSVAIAARYAQKYLGIEKVLIIDWDYHHGNGTESAFYDDPSVLFFSTHDWNAYPGTGDPMKRGRGEGEGFNINVHLPCGATDEMILAAFNKHLIPAAKAFKPELILVSAGFDSRVDDLLGCYNITDQGFIELTQLTMKLADEYCNGRIVSIMEGGYNLKGNASAVVAHVNALTEIH